ncbi:hypothetical protein DFH08DRAFT_794656, partial [Mycena albidolilacea]
VHSTHSQIPEPSEDIKKILTEGEQQTKISEEISTIRQLLKKLERDRSVKRRQLNSALDPVALLPLELSSDIFLRSLPLFPKPGDPSVPILLLNICHAWTDIALSTPSLWAAIHITFQSSRFPSPSTQGLKTLVLIWLRRAHNHPCPYCSTASISITTLSASSGTTGSS